MLFKKKHEREWRQALIDIRDNILLSRDFVTGIAFEGFVRNKEKLYAVVRCLEIISEASRRLSEEMRQRHSHIAWRGIAAAGNLYRHEYHRLHDREIWNTVHDDLPPLLAVVEAELSRLGAGDP